MRRVAVTGGIAEGKSTVLGYLSSLGFSTLSADDVARELLQSPGIQAALGELLGSGPPVSRDALRAALAIEPDLRRSVNRLLHPHILPRLLESQAQFVEVPLLIETCIQSHFDEVWVVACGSEDQLRRLVERVGRREALNLLASQLPTSVKEPFADVIVRTNEPEASVLNYVRQQLSLPASS